MHVKSAMARRRDQRTIAHVVSSPAGVGGAERVISALVRRGNERGWTQVVLNPFAGASSDAGGLPDLVDYRTHRCVRLREFPSTRAWTKRQLEALRPDLVHVHLFHAEVTVASLGRIQPARLLTHHHGDFLIAQGRKLEVALDRWAGRQMDVVVAVSDAVREFLVGEYRYPSEKVVTIRNGWEGAPLPPKRSGSLNILCTANLRPEKGHAVLLKAFAGVVTELADVRLTLVGGGPLQSELENQVDRLGLGQRVRFTGPVDDVWPYLAEADVFVLPSLSEPLGIAIIEAMAAGLPVVATSAGGIPELVRHGDNGLLTTPGDERELAEALVQMLRSPELRTRFGNSGRSIAASLTMARMSDAYEALYDSVARSRET